MDRGVRPPRCPRAGCRAPAAERATEPEIAGRERIAFRERAHGDVVRRPGADPRDGGETRDGVVEPGRHVERQYALRNGRRQRADRCGPGARQTDRRHVGVDERGGRREEVREAVVVGDGRAEGADEAAGQRGRPAHGHLLAEDRADRQLESVPGARDTQSGTARHERRQHAAPGEMPRDVRGVGVEVEEPPRTCHDRRQGRATVERHA